MNGSGSKVRAAQRAAVVAAGVCVAWCSLVAAQQSVPPSSPVRDLDALPLGAVRDIINADTLVVEFDGRRESVRLRGLNAVADEAARDHCEEFLTGVLAGEEVRVEWVEGEPARSGAARGALVYRAPDGLFVNLEAVRQGYCKSDSDLNAENLAVFRFYEQRARTAKKGVWAAREPAKPAKPSPSAEKPGSNPGTETDTVYVTASGKKYHRSGCKHLTDSARAISLAEARKKHEPCSVCKPPP